MDKSDCNWATSCPISPDSCWLFSKHFTERVRQMGISPISVPAASSWEPAEVPASSEAIIAAHDVFACQDCGKCTSACPLALAGKPFSPRFVAAEIIAGRADRPEVRAAVNACLTCGICYERCPSAVNFPEFIKEMRSYYHSREITAAPAHGGFFQSIMRAMTAESLVPRRWLHLPDNIRVRKQSPILFFGGCAAYFDIFFRKFLGVHTQQILEDSLRLLNFFDVEPIVLENERCCGHDLLWSGDQANFMRLARLNAQAIAESGAQEVITACPECYHTLSQEYARYGITLPVKVTHIHEYLEREIDKGAVAFKPLETHGHVSGCLPPEPFQRPGRLAAQTAQAVCARTDPQLLADSDAASVCCGNSAWIGCDAFSKSMQVQRLNAPRETGGGSMITACPKCQIHLRCAMEDADARARR